MKNQRRSPKINNKFVDVTQTEKVTRTITNATKMSTLLTTIPRPDAATTGGTVTKVNKNNQGLTKAVLDPNTLEWRILQPPSGEEQVEQQWPSPERRPERVSRKKETNYRTQEGILRLKQIWKGLAFLHISLFYSYVLLARFIEFFLLFLYSYFCTKHYSTPWNWAFKKSSLLAAMASTF